MKRCLFSNISDQYLVLATTLLLAFCSTGYADHPSWGRNGRDLRSDTWVATDGLDRTTPLRQRTRPPQENRWVGIFYFIWIIQRSSTGPHVIPQIADHPTRNWGPKHAFHWWGQPHLGFYFSDDAFVIRKHAQMLSDAGVDTIVFDVTNGLTYPKYYRKVCEVFHQVRKEGGRSPQVTFLSNANSQQVIEKLYHAFYEKKRFQKLWFRWKGRPLILGKKSGLPEEIRAFFTIRRSWAWTRPKGWFGNGKDKWPWIDHSPQTPGWHKRPDQPEQIPVAPAEHPTKNIGRSFHDGRQPPSSKRHPGRGLYFQEQWERALEVDPPFIFVTGWNEWIAQRFIKKKGKPPGKLMGKPLKPGDTYFVDQFNQEYSRDIEPMRGGHRDNYYYQLVSNVRRYKGVRRLPRLNERKTIRINKNFEQWNSVTPAFRDDRGDTSHRNHAGFGSAGPYVNRSGRNDFTTMKVTRDASSVYVYARTAKPITSPDDPHWMTLLIDVDRDASTGWHGYDRIINRQAGSKEPGIIEKHVEGWQWRRVGQVKGDVHGRQLHMRLPLSSLGLREGNQKIRFDFKWVDRLPKEPDIMDMIDQGDAAPNGRFNYRFKE